MSEFKAGDYVRILYPKRVWKLVSKIGRVNYPNRGFGVNISEIMFNQKELIVYGWVELPENKIRLATDKEVKEHLALRGALLL